MSKLKQTSQKMELRTIDGELNGQTQESGDLIVSGYVNQTGEWSNTLGGQNKFKERIMPGAFQRSLDTGDDVWFLAEHDAQRMLASTKNDSLTLKEDDKGLYMEARISATSYGKDYHTLIQDGLLTNMSFGFRVNEDEWTKTENGMYERSVKDLTLTEVSVVRSPAYVQSSIDARSIELVEEPNINYTEETNMSKEKRAEELRAELAELEAQTEQVEEKVEVRKEKVDVDTDAVEVRGVEEFIKGNLDAEEVRTLTTGNQAITIPTHISNQIIAKLNEEASIFGRAKGFTPVSGTLEILREESIGDATFIGELESAELSGFKFDKVILEQRRAATAIELSQQLVNDSGIDILGYSTGILTRRLASKMDESALIGDKDNKQFEGILTTTKAEVTGTHAAGQIELDDLLDMTLAMHPKYLNGAVFVVNRQTFNQIAKLKDNDGNYHVIRDVINGKPGYRIFGHEILIQDFMSGQEAGAVSVAFVNFREATASMIKKGAALKRISDDAAQSLKGAHLLLLDIYADFKIVNEKAIKFLKQDEAAE